MLLERIANDHGARTDHAHSQIRRQSLLRVDKGPGSSFNYGELEAAILRPSSSPGGKSCHRTHIAADDRGSRSKWVCRLRRSRPDAFGQDPISTSCAQLAQDEGRRCSLMAHLQSNGIDCRQTLRTAAPVFFHRRQKMGLRAHTSYWSRTGPARLLTVCRFHTSMRDEDVRILP